MGIINFLTLVHQKRLFFREKQPFLGVNKLKLQANLSPHRKLTNCIKWNILAEIFDFGNSVMPCATTRWRACATTRWRA